MIIECAQTTYSSSCSWVSFQISWNCGDCSDKNTFREFSQFLFMKIRAVKYTESKRESAKFFFLLFFTYRAIIASEYWIFPVSFLFFDYIKLVVLYVTLSVLNSFVLVHLHYNTTSSSLFHSYSTLFERTSVDFLQHIQVIVFHCFLS